MNLFTIPTKSLISFPARRYDVYPGMTQDDLQLAIKRAQVRSFSLRNFYPIVIDSQFQIKAQINGSLETFSMLERIWQSDWDKFCPSRIGKDISDVDRHITAIFSWLYTDVYNQHDYIRMIKQCKDMLLIDLSKANEVIAEHNAHITSTYENIYDKFTWIAEYPYSIGSDHII